MIYAVAESTLEKVFPDSISKFLRDNNENEINHGEILENYIKLLESNFATWQKSLDDSKSKLSADLKVNKFLDIYRSNNRFKDIKNKSYYLPMDLEEWFDNFYNALDTYINTDKYFIAEKDNEIMHELLLAVEDSIYYTIKSAE